MNGNRITRRVTYKTRVWLIFAVELVFIAGAIYFGYLSRSMDSPLKDPLFWLGALFSVLPTFAFLVIGMLLAIRLPNNPYGWVMIAFSFAMGGWRYFFDTYGGYLYAQGASLRSVGLIAYITSIGWVTGFAMLALILMLFPTGLYFSRVWEIIGRLALVSIAVNISLALFTPGVLGFVAQIENPYSAPGFLGKVVYFLVFASFSILVVSLFAGVISVIVRFIKSKGAERQQIKWFAFATLLLALWLITDNYTELPQPWEALKESLGFVLLPLAIGIAILRYRLWDIDIIIRKTLVYGALTLTLALIYFGSVVLLQSLVTAVGGQQSAVITVISTLLIAALFTPLRRRIQNDIDRRFYRKKYDAEKTLAAFRDNLRQEVDLEELSARLLAIIEETMQPEHCSLWLRKAKK